MVGPCPPTPPRPRFIRTRPTSSSTLVQGVKELVGEAGEAARRIVEEASQLLASLGEHKSALQAEEAQRQAGSASQLRQIRAEQMVTPARPSRAKVVPHRVAIWGGWGELRFGACGWVQAAAAVYERKASHAAQLEAARDQVRCGASQTETCRLGVVTTHEFLSNHSTHHQLTTLAPPGRRGPTATLAPPQP